MCMVQLDAYSFSCTKVLTNIVDGCISKFILKNILSIDNLFTQLKEPIDILKNWDYRVAENLVANKLALEWAQKLNTAIRKIYKDEGEADQVATTKKFAATSNTKQILLPLLVVVTELKNEWGK